MSSGRNAFGLRIALWYATLFVGGAVAIVFLTYYLLSVSLVQRDQQLIRAKLGDYAAAYARGGARGLAAVVQSEQAVTPERLFVRVVDRGVDLEPVADDARVGEQSLPLPRPVPRDLLEIEVVVSQLERRPLLEDREPGESGLVDLQHQSLEEPVVTPDRETVFAIVVRTVKGMAGGDVAVGGHCGFGISSVI